MEVYNLLQDTGRFALVIDPSATSYAADHIDQALLWHPEETSSQSVVNTAFQHLNSRVDFTLVICTESTPDSTLHEPILAEFAAWQKERPRSNSDGSSSCTARLEEALILEGGTAAFQKLFPFACTSSGMEAGRLYPSCVSTSPRVYLSSWGLAGDATVVTALQCTHVVNCTPHHPHICEEKGVSYLRVPVVDERDQDIQSHLSGAVRFIQDAVDAGGVVLVHCKHGQSRSASVLAAWMCVEKGWTVPEAIEYLKGCRPRVGPNEGFRDQVAAFLVDRSMVPPCEED